MNPQHRETEYIVLFLSGWLKSPSDFNPRQIPPQVVIIPEQTENGKGRPCGKHDASCMEGFLLKIFKTQCPEVNPKNRHL